jgi:hypothetical protein
MATRFYYDGHSYLIGSTTQNWSDAATSWSWSDGHLAIISSLDENTAIHDVAAQVISSYAPYAPDGGNAIYLWLGASDIANEGSWEWIDGSSVSNYTNWGSGAFGTEPDNFGGTQDVMAMGIEAWPYPDGGIGVAGEWNDIDPSNKLYSITEWDFLYSFNTDDQMNGTSGLDTVRFNGVLSDYSIAINENNVIVIDSYVGGDGTDTLTNVERLKFLDINVALDLDGDAGQAYRLYKAAFDRAPDLTGLGYWINDLDAGASLLDVSVGFTHSNEFYSLYGENSSNVDFITLLYANVLDRTPDESGYAYWLNELDNGINTREGMLIGFSESAENQLAVIELIANGIEYTEWVG